MVRKQFLPNLNQRYERRSMKNFLNPNLFSFLQERNQLWFQATQRTNHASLWTTTIMERLSQNSHVKFTGLSTSTRQQTILPLPDSTTLSSPRLMLSSTPPREDSVPKHWLELPKIINRLIIKQQLSDQATLNQPLCPKTTGERVMLQLSLTIQMSLKLRNCKVTSLHPATLPAVSTGTVPSGEPRKTLILTRIARYIDSNLTSQSHSRNQHWGTVTAVSNYVNACTT